jgi:hypothetical protein
MLIDRVGVRRYTAVHAEQRDKYRYFDTSITPPSNLLGCRAC